MKCILITHPDFFSGETALIVRLFEQGLLYLHLRKPESTREALAKWIEEIPPVYHSRIIIHDHYALTDRFQLGGIHRNGRNKCPDSIIPFSASCHTLGELKRYKDSVQGYSFLSPLYDSISKAGYRSAFTPDLLQKAADEGVIGESVVALGGITPERIPFLRALGFGGIAVLGYIWNPFLQDKDENALLQRFDALIR